MPRITERLVRAAKARRHRYEVTCSVFAGFVLRVLPSGKKIYYVRVRRDGRYHRVRVGSAETITLAEAHAEARRIIGVSAQGRDTSRRPRGREAAPRFQDFAERYLADHVDRRLKISTRKKYRDHIKLLARAFGWRRLDRITREAIERWHASIGSTPAAANSALRVLRHMFTRAEAWGVMPSGIMNPARGVRLHREHKRERFLTPDERRRLEQVLREAEILAPRQAGSISWATAGAIRLLALTGMRRSEVTKLTWSMVDTQHRCLRLPDSKTGPKIVPLGSPAMTQLRLAARHKIGNSAFIFFTRTGRPLNGQALGRAWRGIRKRAGLDDVRLHDLRHSAASDALMAGVPLAVVGKILGHKKPATTARYAHISDDVLADAAELMAITIASRSRTGELTEQNPEGEGTQ